MAGMSLCFSYRCGRDRPLSDQEAAEVAEVLAVRCGRLWNVRLEPDDPPVEGCVLSGSGRPPTGRKALTRVLNEWVDWLSHLARTLGGSWQVQLDKLVVPWDATMEKFDLSKVHLHAESTIGDPGSR